MERAIEGDWKVPLCMKANTVLVHLLVNLAHRTKPRLFLQTLTDSIEVAG